MVGQRQLEGAVEVEKESEKRVGLDRLKERLDQRQQIKELYLIKSYFYKRLYKEKEIALRNFTRQNFLKCVSSEGGEKFRTGQILL